MSDPVVLLSTGDVVGPAGGVTDNSMVLFSGTSGKLIKGNNAVVTAAGLALLDDVNAGAQRVTLGLGNVDNTSDASKPVSTATQTALNLKANINSPTFTGSVSIPAIELGSQVGASNAFIDFHSGAAVTDYDSRILAAAGTGNGTAGNGTLHIVAGVVDMTTGAAGAQTVRVNTAVADTNSTIAASTAFVVGQASSTAPVMDGTAAVGTSMKYARANHVHPSDTTKVSLAGGNMTGDLIYQNVAAGGWARGLSARIQSSGAIAGGIGFLGTSDSFSNVYLGVGDTPWSSGNGVRVTAAGVTISGATTFDTLITGSVNGSASTLSGNQSNWAGIRSNAVANMLGWNNYGNGHVIFDASSSTSPSGSAVNNANATNPWSAAYPTLMGWNGSTTYGVRVDSARVADGTPWTGVSGKPTTLGGYGITNGYSMDGVNTGWFRSSNTTGWYNETFGGGIYMTDSSYVRTYNGKGFVCNNDIIIEGASPTLRLNDTDHAISRYVHANGGSVGFLKGDGTWGLSNDNSGNTYSTGSITSGGEVYATNLLGQGQTWQDLTGSRTFGVTYTNSTGRPIVVSIGFKAASSDDHVYFRVNGVVVFYGSNGGSGETLGAVGNIVPAGATYILNRTLGSIESWAELR